ncbi:MAG: S8 family serine peptidase, partial [Planctomycetia bacterium]|nr:S8 family serine peptidase [Actinomycetota bacterium]MCA1686653.1 S8 family serine peptidase [Planctomycetia bacterium]
NHPDLYQNIWLNQAEIPVSRLRNLADVFRDGFISWRDLNDPANIGPGKIVDVNGDGRIDAGDVLAPMVKDANGKDTGAGGWGDPNNVQDGDNAHPDDLIGWNFVANTNDPRDDLGHGTQSAGVIAAAGNNGAGVVGVTWSSQVMALKFIDATGNGSSGNAAAAVLYAAGHGARVANAGFGAYGTSQALRDAIANAGNQGMVFVAGAGNDAVDTDLTPFYPASFHLATEIAVAAIDTNDQLASFSNYGPQTVDLGAPGTGIETTLAGGSYGQISGTSAAAPFVTGTVALAAAAHPTWTAGQLVKQVLATVTPDPALAGKTVTGGVVNASAAVGPRAFTTTPTVVWPVPADLVYGTPLGSDQLDATAYDSGAPVPGLFTYNPAPGTVLNAGPGQTLSVTFIPDDAKDYTTATAAVAVNVLKATPVINWPAPAPITYGTALGPAQLGASSGVAGTFAYSAAPGTVPGAGQLALSVAFTPADPGDYNTAAAATTLNVTRAHLFVQADNKSQR